MPDQTPLNLSPLSSADREVEAALASLAPSPVSFDFDSLAFRAGASSMQRRAQLWRAVAAVLAVALGASIVLPQRRAVPEPVPAALPTPIAKQKPSPEPVPIAPSVPDAPPTAPRRTPGVLVALPQRGGPAYQNLLRAAAMDRLDIWLDRTTPPVRSAEPFRAGELDALPGSRPRNAPPPAGIPRSFAPSIIPAQLARTLLLTGGL